MKGPQVKCILFALIAVGFTAGSFNGAHAQSGPTIPAFCSEEGAPGADTFCFDKAAERPPNWACQCADAIMEKGNYQEYQVAVLDCQSLPQTQQAACLKAASTTYANQDIGATASFDACMVDLLIPMEEGYPQDCINNSGGGGVNGLPSGPPSAKLNLDNPTDLPRFVRVRQQAPAPKPIPPAPTPVPKSPVT